MDLALKAHQQSLKIAKNLPILRGLIVIENEYDPSCCIRRMNIVHDHEPTRNDFEMISADQRKEERNHYLIMTTELCGKQE